MKKLYILMGLILLSMQCLAEIIYPYDIPAYFNEDNNNDSTGHYRVQGVASSCEVSHECQNETIYVAMDHSATKATIILAYQGENRSPKTCYIMNHNKVRKGHAGGLAYDNDSLYVSTGGKVVKMIIPQGSTSTLNIKTEEDLENCMNLTVDPIAETIKLTAEKVKASSYTSIFTMNNEKYIIVGSYCENISIRANSPYCIVDKNADTYTYKFPYAYIYRLDENGHQGEAPIAKYKVPFKTQGIDVEKHLIGVTQNDDLTMKFHFENYLVSSVSGGSTSSSLYWYKLDDLKCLNNNDCPDIQNGGNVDTRVTFLEDMEQKSVTSLPPKIEDLAISEGKIWSASEKQNDQKIYFFTHDIYKGYWKFPSTL